MDVSTIAMSTTTTVPTYLNFSVYPCMHIYTVDPRDTPRRTHPPPCHPSSSPPPLLEEASSSIMAGEPSRACDIYRTRDVQGFHFRVSHSATKNLAAGECVEKVLALVNGFRVTARCWPHCWEGIIKLSVVITSMLSQQRLQAPKVAAASIDLRNRDGRPVRTGRQQPETVVAGDDCFGGVAFYASRDEVEKDCLVDDHFTAICTVTILRDWPPLDLPVPYNLGSVIFSMPDLSDVSFQVGGHTLKAHRLVLAACSPVFRAMLFGEMVESRASSIAIEDDTRPNTFGCMLYYMYHNVLPPPPAAAAAGTMMGDDDNAAEMMEFQHLFVAADKYGLDKLKETCEEMMFAGIKTSTVLSIMEFAEECARPKLKAKCLDFLAVPGNFQEVAATQEYLDLMTKLPSLLAQVRDRCRRPRLVV
ncbi:BTB/POZ and MATH domain-containing protein 1 [Sorghum bicolor]|uniref:BTB/POZ and MATH domain-containing protein 1 n=1 Tax=Sorghum bicolor TaxID=4558 RepID=UPI000B426108|nr:BTB/POZ and MATH domain-containing protein 1 [Sorghum bicolor]|eukprot:XP_002462249.2 BTB/POZ and MATH domain-containing protein 1 [Sorghum bicolor]